MDGENEMTIKDGTGMKKTRILMIICLIAGFISAYKMAPRAKTSPGTPQEKGKFVWPAGKRAAISLTFDDARPSQIDMGMPIFDKYGVRATFYISPDNIGHRLKGWKRAVKNGHEIGNHTTTHPCTGNYAFSRENAIEDMTLEAMAGEIDKATQIIVDLLGVRPESFAYPCGQAFVGRGRDVKSTIPLVAERFLTGRGWLGEDANDPEKCDPIQLMAMESDGRIFDQIKPLIDKAATEGRWLILAGHEIGEGGFQTTLARTVEEICRYATDPANRLWIDTVGTIGRYVINKREPPSVSR
jgi:peptidoglycan/xylan/chitin deacetylase (PgdA/CDA1 family)